MILVQYVGQLRIRVCFNYQILIISAKMVANTRTRSSYNLIKLNNFIIVNGDKGYLQCHTDKDLLPFMNITSN